MEITTQAVHRALAYVAMVTDQGHRLTAEEFNTYVEAVNLASVPRGLEALIRPFAPWVAERVPTDAQKIGWLTEDPDGYVVLTSLGKAVLRALDQQQVESGGPLDIVLDATDPMAYPQVINRIAQHKEPLLVDPYFKLDHFLHVVHQTETARLLTGPNPDLPGLATALESSLPPDRRFEIRVHQAVHDRYVIPPVGPLDQLGTSLSGVGKKPTAMVRVNPPAADAIREVHERLWNEAKALDAKSAPALAKVSRPGETGRGRGRRPSAKR